jgi:hypothetical protein
LRSWRNYEQINCRENFLPCSSESYKSINLPILCGWFLHNSAVYWWHCKGPWKPASAVHSCERKHSCLDRFCTWKPSIQMFALMHLFCCTGHGQLRVCHAHSHIITCNQPCSLAAQQTGFIWTTHILLILKILKLKLQLRNYKFKIILSLCVVVCCHHSVIYFIYYLFNSAINMWSYIASIDRMINESERIWKEMVVTYFKVVSLPLPRWSEEIRDRLQSG